jgi:tRNA(Ile)-lysidine synthase
MKRQPKRGSLLDQVRETVGRRQLLAPGDGVVVAVSGGADSLAMLHLLTVLQAEWSLRLVAAHLHHGMRGIAADEDAAFVAATAERWGVTCVVENEDVPGLARAARIGLEEAGRVARYRFFARVAGAQQCDHIATAHTADDRVETVLLNLFRGTGIDGLAGIPARRPLSADQPLPEVVRPLIDCWRRDVVAYCAAHGLEPRWDVSNEAREHARNRVRLELLPWLERELSPAARQHLLRLAGLAEEEGALLGELARELLDQARVSDSATEIRLRSGTLAEAPPPLARRALLAALRSLGGPAASGGSTTLDALLRLVRGELVTAIAVPESPTSAAREGEILVLRVALVPAEPPKGTAQTLLLPGCTHVPQLGSCFEAQILPRPEAVQADPAHEAFLDLKRLQLPLSARTPRPGDRIVPLGMTGHRKLHDLFIDRKVPREQRARVPVIADAERIVWVIGHCVSEEAKVRRETRQVVHLKVSGVTSADHGIIKRSVGA